MESTRIERVAIVRRGHGALRSAEVGLRVRISPATEDAPHVTALIRVTTPAVGSDPTQTVRREGYL